MLIVKKILKSPVSVPLMALILISLVIGSTTDVFWQADNMRNIVLQVGIVSIMSVGATFVILTGGIDLSPGSAMCLLTMILASTVKLQGLPTLIGVIIVLIIGILLGLFNGVVTAYLRIPAFITTLAENCPNRSKNVTQTNKPLLNIGKLRNSRYYSRFSYSS